MLRIILWVTLAVWWVFKSGAEVEVVNTKGDVSFSGDQGRTWNQFTDTNQVAENCVFKTGPGACVDLRFKDGSLMRVTEKSVVAIDKAEVNTESAEILIDLRNGRISAEVRKISPGSKFEIKTPVGVAGALGQAATFDGDSHGTFRCVRGSIVVFCVVVPPCRQPPHTLQDGEQSPIFPPKIEKIPDGALKKLGEELKHLRTSAEKRRTQSR